MLVSKEVKSSRVRKEGLLSRILLMLDDKVFKHFTGVEQLKREGIGIDLDSKDTEREREKTETLKLFKHVEVIYLQPF